MTDVSELLPSIPVLGVRVHMVQMSDTLDLLERWIQQRDRCRFVVATGMHGVMEARKRTDFKAIVNSADLLVPDGMALVWFARRRGFPLKKRVCGPDLMWDFCHLADRRGYKVFFYGDTDETLRLLCHRLKTHFPHLNVAGVHSPPFRELTSDEAEDEIEMINRSGADVVWVGLGLPKQERWMYARKDRLTVPVVIGVGAAFKFLSGQVRRAPSWMGDHGLEWLWRFLTEPRKVWRRVMLDGPRFACYATLELTGLKRYD